MGKWLYWLLALVLAPTLVAGCAAKPAPLPTVAPTPSAQQALIPSPATPAAPAGVPVPSGDAWAQVVRAARQEGKVTMYSFIFSGETAWVVSRAFEEKHGIKLELVTGVGAVLLERLRSERAAGKYIADTYDTAPSWVATAKREGITEPLGPLPVLDEKDVWNMFPRLDPEGHILAFGISRGTSYANTALVKAPEEPRSYQDMLDPKWKGKIVISDPATDPLPIQLYLLGKKHGFIDDEYMRRLARQDLRIVTTVRDVATTLARGEASLAWKTSTAIVNPFILEGAPLKPLTMNEGARQAASPAIGLIKNAPHPNAARFFIQWLLSQEGQTIYHRVRGSDSLRKDVPDFNPPTGRITASRFLIVDLEMELETVRVQRERILNKLLGMER